MAEQFMFVQFYDISEQVIHTGEQGWQMLGIEADMNYPSGQTVPQVVLSLNL